MSNIIIVKIDCFKIKRKAMYQYQGQMWMCITLLPQTPLKKTDWCVYGPSPSLYFYLGPGGIGSRWGTWSPLSFTLSLSALGWSFLYSDQTLSMPATFHPLETKWRAGNWIKHWNLCIWTSVIPIMIWKSNNSMTSVIFWSFFIMKIRHYHDQLGIRSCKSTSQIHFSLKVATMISMASK